MRIIALLLLVAAGTGCAHALPAGRPSDEAYRRVLFGLLDDAADDAEFAKAYADKEGVPAAPRVAAAEAAYRKAVLEARYLQAAAIAHHFDLKPERVSAVFAIVAGKAEPRAADGGPIDALTAASAFVVDADALADEIAIACRYGNEAALKERAREDALLVSRRKGEPEWALRLLTEGCRYDPKRNDELLDGIIYNGLLLSEWPTVLGLDVFGPAKRKEGAEWFFRHGHCDQGIPYVSEAGLSAEEAGELLEPSRCGGVIDLSAAWSLRDEGFAAHLFFSAVRGGNDRIACMLVPHAGLGNDGYAYVAQEVFRHGREYAFVRTLVEGRVSADAALDLFFGHALAIGRHRFVGFHARKGAWLWMAFRASLEDGEYEFAAEMAHYGQDERLKREGFLMASEAALRSGAYKEARAIAYRFEIPDDVFDGIYVSVIEAKGVLVAMEEAMLAGDFVEARRMRDLLRVSDEDYWSLYHAAVEVRAEKAGKPVRKRRKPRCDDWTVSSKDPCMK